MPILQDWEIPLTIEQVLQAQGVDPNISPGLSARLVETAAQALKLGSPLIKPLVVYRQYKVKALQHERMLLYDGKEQASLTGKAIVSLLSRAKGVVVLACTIGEALENFVSAMLPENPALGLALDALGSVAVQTLMESACAYFGEQAGQRDWGATIPFSPGMEGWPSDRGQAALFTLLGGANLLSTQVGLSLNPSGMIHPIKSVTSVIGLGPEMDGSGRVCDYCSARQTCRYQDHY